MHSEGKRELVEKGRAAMTRVADEFSPREPLAAAIARSQGLDGHDILEFWSKRSIGSPIGEQRYRWEVSHKRGTGIPAYLGQPEDWQWRGSEGRRSPDPFLLEQSLCLPIQLTETLEWLAQADGDGTSNKMFLDEAMPRIRRDFAQCVLAQHAWFDTFALWCLCRRPEALRRLRPLAVAIAETYVALLSESGEVLGTRYPDHGKPLHSASAHLGRSLVALGLHLPLAARLLAYSQSAFQPEGGASDIGHQPVVLTTLVCGEFGLMLDPCFDVSHLVAGLARLQSDDGLFRVFGPEAPWLTSEVLSLVGTTTVSFAERFVWPDPSRGNLDSKTGLPSYAYFLDISELLSAVDSLASARVQVAFIDLAGFGAFNNRFGQEAGDGALSAFAEHLGATVAGRAIRDGGDEFLVVGAPTCTVLYDSLEDFRHSWPLEFRKRFGDIDVVSPRIVTRTCRAKELRDCREYLGRAVGQIKAQPVPAAGLLVSMEQTEHA